jgi:predicted ArsR family transcriptional regulator
MTASQLALVLGISRQCASNAILALARSGAVETTASEREGSRGPPARLWRVIEPAPAEAARVAWFSLWRFSRMLLRAFLRPNTQDSPEF